MTEISVEGDRIWIESEFQHKDRCKMITGSRWHPESKRWWVKASPGVAKEINLSFAPVGYGADSAFTLLLAQAWKDDAARLRSMQGDIGDLPEFESKTKPYEHQRRAYAFCLDGGMLAMDMGTGKSKVAVDLCVNRDARLVWVSCPKSVIGVWEREFERHGARPYRVVPLKHHTVKAKAREAERAIELSLAHNRRPLVLVTNHESIWREPLGDLVKAQEPDAFILDESHRAKQHNGRLSKYLGQLAHFPFKLALTGTPMPHSPLDIYAQYRFLEPSIFGPSYWQFRNKYAVMGGFENHEIVAYQNVEELNERVYRKAFFCKLEDCFDLPEEIDEPRTFELSKEGLEAYRTMERDMVLEIGDGLVTASNAMVKLLRAQQITSGYARDEAGTDHRVCDAKKNLLYDLIDKDIPPSEPVIVFCRFRHDLDTVAEIATALGRTYGELSGPNKELINDKGELQEGIDVGGVQIQAGGVGVDFVKSKYAVYYSLGFSLSDYEQSRRRLHRHGQTRSVVYFHLIAEGTVDETVYSVLERRGNLIKAVLARAERENRL